MDDELKGIIKITFAAILFGIIPLIVKLSGINSYILSASRIIIALMVFFIWFLFGKMKFPTLKHNKIKLLIFGILHAAIILFSFFAIKTINVAVASVLIYAGTIYLVVLSAIFLKEKINFTTIFATGLCFVGIIIIFWNVFSSGFSGNVLGYLAGFFAGFFMAITYLMGKILSRDYSGGSMTLLQNLIALPFVIPLLFVGSFVFNLENILVILFLGIFCTAIPFFLLYSGMRNVKGQKVGIILTLELIIPVVLSFVVLNEFPSVLEVFGGALILIGYFTVSFSKK